MFTSVLQNIYHRCCADKHCDHLVHGIAYEEQQTFVQLEDQITQDEERVTDAMTHHRDHLVKLVTDR